MDLHKISKNRKQWTKKRVFILVICLLAGIGAIYKTQDILAKYYAAKYNKGIAVASNLYFNSDKLAKSSGITDVDAIVQDESVINKINVYTNSGSWSSGDLLLNFDIRNYDNNILYNEKDLNIEYKVFFVLLDEPEGAEYSVISPDGTSYALNSENRMAEMKGTVTGGSLDAQTYGIQIRMTSQETYNAARVFVLAYPTSPDYVYRESGENQEYRLLGIFSGHPTDMKITIENAKFKVQDEENYGLTTWKSKVEDLSGYIYNIKTAGDVVMDSETAAKQQAVVTWDNRYLTINKYDENYQYALEHDAAGNGENYISQDGNYTSMTIMVLPYTSIDITFYKTENFKQTLQSYAEGSTDGKEWFEGLVKAEIAE